MEPEVDYGDLPPAQMVQGWGQAQFDSGLHEATLDNPVAYVGELLAKYHTFAFHPGEEIGARRESIGIAPESINIVINSHLHFYHCGGNRQLPNADILIQSKALAHARAVQSSNGYLTSDWDTGQRFRAVDGEHDVFGDGTVVCLPPMGICPVINRHVYRRKRAVSLCCAATPVI